MDSLTQAVLSACVQYSVLGKVQKRKTLMYGAILGTVPDLDIFINHPNLIDKLTYHRGFSHSIFILTTLSIIITFLARKFAYNNAYSTKRLFLAVWLALVTHPILDAFTIFGTQLFWPLNYHPISEAAVFIIDPLFTIPLLIVTILALIKPNKFLLASNWVLSWCILYLAFGTYSRITIENSVRTQLENKGIQIQRVKGTPTFANNLLWIVLVETKDNNYYFAIQSIFDKNLTELIYLKNNSSLKDIIKNNSNYKRYSWFTDDWLYIHNLNNNLILSDVRMGMPKNFIFNYAIAKLNKKNTWIWENPKTIAIILNHPKELKVQIKLVFARIFDSNIKIFNY